MEPQYKNPRGFFAAFGGTWFRAGFTNVLRLRFQKIVLRLGSDSYCTAVESWFIKNKNRVLIIYENGSAVLDSNKNYSFGNYSEEEDKVNGMISNNFNVNQIKSIKMPEYTILKITFEEQKNEASIEPVLTRETNIDLFLHLYLSYIPLATFGLN